MERKKKPFTKSSFCTRNNSSLHHSRQCRVSWGLFRGCARPKEHARASQNEWERTDQQIDHLSSLVGRIQSRSHCGALKVVKRSALRKARSVPLFDARRKCCCSR